MAKRIQTFHGAGLFAETPADAKPAAAAYRVNIDGGSRGNPGPASYGVVVRNERGEIVAKLKKYIGRTSNNVAEYYSLIAALDYAQAHGVRALRVESDSELLVKQMRGQYKVRSEDLRPLFERVKKMSQTFASFRIDHVYREQNAEADALANEALDEASGLTRKAVAHSGDSERPSGPGERGGPGERAASGKRSDTLRIRARYRGGALHPVKALDLPENAEVEVVVKLAPEKP
jgi:ribonuclease HI